MKLFQRNVKRNLTHYSEQYLNYHFCFTNNVTFDINEDVLLFGG